MICLLGIEKEQDLVRRDEVVCEEVEDMCDSGVFGGWFMGMMLAGTIAVHFV